MPTLIETRLEQWKLKLLDLSFRNPFLNFKHPELMPGGKAPKRDTLSLRIVDESPAELLRLLYAEQTDMLVQPWQADRPVNPPQRLTTINPDDLLDCYVDEGLQTTLPEDRLPRVLKKIHAAALESQEERGINTLHIALGMMAYQDPKQRIPRPKAPASTNNDDAQPNVLENDVTSPTTKTLWAPLLLLPVALEEVRIKGEARWMLSSTQEDWWVNPVLQRKLHQDFALTLPDMAEEPDWPASLYNWFRQVEETIKLKEDWWLSSDCFLGFFSFQKFAMVKDIETHTAQYLNHSLVQNLANPASETNHTVLEAGLPCAAQPDSLDAQCPPEQCFHVVDADSSQQRAIQLISQGKHLVIEGPPGTGKSQTITNLVANALAENKSILFVAEKGAAVSVVESRLKREGLGDFCLNLHGTKVSRNEVLAELQRVWDASAQASPANDTLSELKHQLPNTRRALTGYVAALHQPMPPLGKSLYQLYGRFSQLRDVPRPLYRLPKDVLQWDARQLNEGLEYLKQYGHKWATLHPLAQHPWQGCHLQSLSSFDKQEVQTVLSQQVQALQYLSQQAQLLASQLGSRVPTTFGDIGLLCDVARTLCDSPKTSSSVLSNPAWDAMPEEAQTLLKLGQNWQKLHQLLSETFSQNWFEQSDEWLTSLLHQLEKGQRKGLFKLLDSDYRQARKLVQGYLLASTGNQPAKLPPDTTLTALLQQSLQCRQARMQLEAQAEVGQALFGNHWHGLASNWQHLEQFAQWIVKVRGYAVAELLEAKGLDLAVQGQDTASSAATKQQVLELETLVAQLQAELQALAKRFELDDTVKRRILQPQASLDASQDSLKCWQNNFSLLEGWMQWNTLQAELAKQPLLCAYVSAYQNTPQLEPKKETPTPEGLAPAFEALYFQQLIDFMEQSQPELRSFQADSHEGLRQQFKQQDQAITQATQQALIERLRTQVRKGMSELEQTPRTFLQGQIKATRGRRSLRTLLRMGAKGVRTLKPCFMMSPLSVTEFIDPTLYQFDIIIFDEASQVRPEEALGAIVRGKQLVVVGDSKQLPPTSFFGGSGSSEHSFDDVEEDLTEEELALISEEESILDQCLKSGFPSHTLRWHYRSRHESLITFSNRYLYDNNLLSFPSPEAEHEVMGLHFEQVPDGVYLGKGKNLREAERIVEAVVAHAHQRPNRTLGVATFGASQKTVIDELLDNRRLQDSQLDAFLRSHGDEGFFVKNLENVQGDERDLIFISVTYGPQANGKFVYNFGPINSEGGKRRLNVIATRARLGTRLFASFHPDQLRAESLNSEGARLLKAYLSFAAGGQLETATVNAIDAFDSAFEEAVAEALRLNGYEVRTQVGQSGYRIDLGVLDPACPGRFLAGVECDGATYHSSATARDRDRLRQQVLEGLGWTILRVWSTDWFREPEAALARLLSQLEAAKEALAQPTEATSLALPQTHEPTLELPLTDADKQLLQGQLPPLPAYRCVPNPSQLLGEAKAFPTVANLQLQLLILAILAIEAPICLDELTRRVVAHWGMLRISDRSRFKVDEVLNWMQNSGQPITYSQGFVWLTQQTIIARDRSQLSPLPKPESIAGNELAACIQHVLTYRGVLMADALVRECSRCLGYGRLSAQFTNQLHDVVDSLCQTGQLVHVSTGLQWVSVEASTSNTHDPNKVFV